jgi:hypothetical protein
MDLDDWRGERDPKPSRWSFDPGPSTRRARGSGAGRERRPALESPSESQSRPAKGRPSAFQLFKYAVFAIVLVNLCFYLAEDVTAFLYLDENAPFSEILETFAVTIDYSAWMILIVLLEIETTVRARDALHGVRRWTIVGLTAVCYGVLLFPAYSYVAWLIETYRFEPMPGEAVCGLVEDTFAYLDASARPIELTAENCRAFADEQVYKAPSDHLVATRANLTANQWLAWVDVANAVAWLLVILIFQIEIFLDQLEKLTRPWLVFCTGTKVLLYLVLAGNALYWTIYSNFIDYWDAWIWLVAFVLIDMNLLGMEGEDSRAVHATRMK